MLNLKTQNFWFTHKIKGRMVQPSGINMEHYRRERIETKYSQMFYFLFTKVVPVLWRTFPSVQIHAPRIARNAFLELDIVLDASVDLRALPVKWVSFFHSEFLNATHIHVPKELVMQITFFYSSSWVCIWVLPSFDSSRNLIFSYKNFGISQSEGRFKL